jgi:hypothetical protein
MLAVVVAAWNESSMVEIAGSRVVVDTREGPGRVARSVPAHPQPDNQFVVPSPSLPYECGYDRVEEDR